MTQALFELGRLTTLGVTVERERKTDSTEKQRRGVSETGPDGTREESTTPSKKTLALL